MSGESSFNGVELGRILAGRTHAPVVYFVRMGRNNVKIGTTTNLRRRIQSFYLSLEDVLVAVPGGPDVEAAYHERFAKYRLAGNRRELFQVAGQLLAFLEPGRQAPPTAESAPAAPGKPGRGITLAEAVEAGIFGYANAAAVKKRLQRHPNAPSPIVAGYQGGPAHRYDEEALHEYAAK